MYFDTSYIAKFYLNEPESDDVRGLARKSRRIRSSAWAFTEFHAVLHRHIRERRCSPAEARGFASEFSAHIETGIWELLPVREPLLRRTGALIVSAPNNMLLRAGDAVHLTTALDAGELEVWTSDRRMLAAAPYFGLNGRCF